MFWSAFILLSLPVWFFLVLPWLKKDHATVETPNGKRHIFSAVTVLLIGIFGSIAVYLNTSSGYHTLIAIEKVNHGVQQLLTDIVALEEQLQKDPNNSDGWQLLAEAHIALGQYSAAVQAYQQLERLNKLTDVNTLLSYSEVLIVSELDIPKAQSLLDQVLVQDTDNSKAIFLYGVLKFGQTEYDQALVHWEALYNNSGGDMPVDMRNTLANMIVEARKRGAETMIDNAGSADVLRILVRLNDQFAGTLAADTAVFVYVRAADGPPMPLAVRRLTVADLPAQITLDDSDAMVEGMSFKEFTELDVFGRVSMSGQARQQAGDLIGSGKIKLTSDPAEVTIDINEIVK